MDTLNDKKLALCRKNLNLIKSFIHHCGLQQLGVYTSAGHKVMQLLDETLAAVGSTNLTSVAQTRKPTLLKKAA